jgi:hypothetical protein
MTKLVNWLNSYGVSDLGENAFLLLELVKSKKNSRFMDIGVRGGVSSAILSYQSKENNNLVCGCDINFNLFFERGRKYVNDNYTCYLCDSVTLGKEWDEDPFDIIFIDTEHTREYVLSELYFWSNHIKENGYFVFHDSHWEVPGYTTPGFTDGEYINHERVDVAITDFFGLPKSVREMTYYEDDNIILEHHTPSLGMTFVQVKTLDSIEKFKKNVDWNKVFEIRNLLIDRILNEKNPKCASKDWGLEYGKIKYEPIINVN